MCVVEACGRHSKSPCQRARPTCPAPFPPATQLGQGEPNGTVYATQLAFLKDNSGATYFYRTPGNNAWLAVRGVAGFMLRPRARAASDSTYTWPARCAARAGPRGRQRACLCISARVPPCTSLLIPRTCSWRRAMPDASNVPRFPPAGTSLMRQHSAWQASAPVPRPAMLHPALQVDLKALSDAQSMRYFPLAQTAPVVPFASDVTAAGAAVA